MTPEDEQMAQEEEMQRQAQMQAAALRGQAPAMAPAQGPDINPLAVMREADVLSGLGGAMAGWGGRTGQAISENATKQGNALRELLEKRRGNAAIEANRGMEQAVKDKFPDVWARLQGQGLTDAAWAKVYMQGSADERTNTTQTNINNRFTKDFGLRNTKQTADLGARETYGAQPIDPNNVKPISQEQATSLANMKAAADTVLEKTKKAKEIYAKGTPLPGTQEDRFLRQLIVETYGPMLTTGNIGNLTDSHLHLLKDMLANPSGDWATYINNDLFPAMLDELATGASNNLEHQANSLGRTFKRAPPQETKVIGGKTYTKKNGKWTVKE